MILPKEGDTEKFRNKCFEEINIPEYVEESENHGADDGVPNLNEAADQSRINDGFMSKNENETIVGIIGPKTIKCRKRTLIPWTEEQKRVTEFFFSNHIKEKIPPKKDEVMMLKEKYPKLFSNKPYPTIKAYVWNKYRNK